MKFYKLVLFISILIFLAGCTTRIENDSDYNKVEIDDGILVVKFDSNISAFNEILSGGGAKICLQNGKTEKKECFIDTTSYSKDKVAVISVKPGRYYWHKINPPNMLLRIRFPRLEKQPYVIAEKGVITYIGNIEIKYDFINILNPIEYINVVDKEHEIVNLLNRDFSKLMADMKFKKEITEIKLKN